MAKKLIFIICIMLLVFPLVISACTTSASNSSSNITTAVKWSPKKPVRIVLHLGTGTSYDNYARGIAPYLSKYLGAEVTVDNVLGSGGLAGLMELWRAKPDGYTIGLVDVEKFVAYQMVGKMDYDIKKFEWLASPATGYYLLGVANNSQFKNIQDIITAGQTRPLRFIVSEIGTTEAITTAVLGIKTSYVINQLGGSDQVLAMVRGDADMKPVSESMYAPFIESKDIRPIMYYRDRKSDILSGMGIDCPTVVELGYPALASLYSPRGFALPPGAPPEIIGAYQAAFSKAFSDQALIEWGTKAKCPIIPGDRKDVLKSIDGLSSLYGQYSDILKQYIKF